MEFLKQRAGIKNQAEIISMHLGIDKKEKVAIIHLMV